MLRIISGNIDELPDQGSMRRIDSNADESDGKVCNIIAFSRPHP